MFATAMNAKPGTMISSPGCSPSPRYARWIAGVPFETASACLTSRIPLISFSSCSTYGPPDIHVDSSALLAYSISLPQYVGLAQGIIFQKVDFFYIQIPFYTVHFKTIGQVHAVISIKIIRYLHFFMNGHLLRFDIVPDKFRFQRPDQHRAYPVAPVIRVHYDDDQLGFYVHLFLGRVE